MERIKGIIFDYGGTIDTNGIHWGEFIWEQYKAASMEVSHEEFRKAYVHGERTLAKHPIIEPTDTFRRLLGKKLEIQFGYLRENTTTPGLSAGKAHAIAEACYREVVSTMHTTRAIVERLSGKFPMVLVTNFYGNMPVVLKEFGLERFFKEIIESSVVGIRKPDPELFAMGCRALGMEAGEVLVIGDSYRKDIYPSTTLGCSTVWLKNVCWEEENVEPGHEPTAIITSLEQLAGAVPEIV